MNGGCWTSSDHKGMEAQRYAKERSSRSGMRILQPSTTHCTPRSTSTYLHELVKVADAALGDLLQAIH